MNCTHPLLARRALVLGLAATTFVLAGCAGVPATTNLAPVVVRPPIVFVHGNGDSAGVWLTTQWRFETNGWPRERLFALDMPYPLARDDNAKPQEPRSSSQDQAAFLKAQIEAIRASTGAAQVVLMANSRGGITVRNYIQTEADAGRQAPVSHAILGGTPNHGVWASPAFLPGSEFNGTGSVLVRLNTPKGPDGAEVTPGVKWLTVRSDVNDKFAQPQGAWIGSPGKPTGVTFDGPALKGAQNVVLKGIDHRETSFGPGAFAASWRFITGSDAGATAVAPESRVVLNGKVNGVARQGAGLASTNLPAPGAKVELYVVNPITGVRLGGAVHQKTVGMDGLWGPYLGSNAAAYEFVVTPPLGAIGTTGVSPVPLSTVHIYRSPFARSSNAVHLRLDAMAPADKDAGSVLTLTRPRGYFGLGRDTMSFDNLALPGILEGVAGTAAAKIKLAPGTTERSVVATFNGERIVARSWPASENRVVVLELHN